MLVWNYIRQLFSASQKETFLLLFDVIGSNYGELTGRTLLDLNPEGLNVLDAPRRFSSTCLELPPGTMAGYRSCCWRSPPPGGSTILQLNQLIPNF